MKKKRIAHNRTHNMSQTPIYARWKRMHARCKTKTSDKFKYYGGRGIKVCKRWGRFENFYKDMGMPKDGYSLERVNNDGNYCKKNCVWANHTTQMRNTRITWFITYDGITRPVTEWSEITGVSTNNIRKRINRGWPMSLVFTNKIFKKYSVNNHKVVKGK